MLILHLLLCGLLYANVRKVFPVLLYFFICCWFVIWSVSPSNCWSIQFFLGATRYLYNWLCPLVFDWSVGRLVGWLVGLMVTHYFGDPHVVPIGLSGLFLSCGHATL